MPLIMYQDVNTLMLCLLDMNLQKEQQIYLLLLCVIIFTARYIFTTTIILYPFILSSFRKNNLFLYTFTNARVLPIRLLLVNYVIYYKHLFVGAGKALQ